LKFTEKLLDIFAQIILGTVFFTVIGAFFLMVMLFLIYGLGFLFNEKELAFQIVGYIMNLLWIPAIIIGIVGTLAYTLAAIGYIQWTGSWFDEKLEPLWKWVEKQISKVYSNRE